MERFLNRGWELILTGCGGTSALAGEATHAARWLHEPQPISNRPVGLGFSHHGGRYQRVRPPFSSAVGQSCRCMEGFQIRGWVHTFPGWRWLYGPRLGFPHREGRHRTGRPSSSPGCWSCRCSAGFMLWGWDLTLPRPRWPYKPQVEVKQRASGARISTPVSYTHLTLPTIYSV